MISSSLLLQLLFPGKVERNVRHVAPRVGLNVRETLPQLGQLSAVFIENRTIRIEISQPQVAVSVERNLFDQAGIKCQFLTKSFTAPYDIESGAAERTERHVDQVGIFDQFLLWGLQPSLFLGDQEINVLRSFM